MLKKEVLKFKERLIRLRDDIFGDREYEKFIIVTRSRTGSNLLISLLNSHSQIFARGEIFRRLEGKSCDQIWKAFFRKRPSHLAFIGFKIFYYHPLDSDDKSVWDFIQDDKKIKNIHLKRRNILKTYVSREIAGKTDIWTNKKNKKIPLSERRITVDLEDLKKEIDLTLQNQDDFGARFQNHDILDIWYEDLVKNKEKEMHRLFDFLGVEKQKVESSYKKQNKESLKDLIINYDEVSKALSKSSLKHMLE